MNETYRIEDGTYGRRAVLTSSWRDGLASEFLGQGVVELVLNYSKGWQGNDLTFLSDLPQLRSLVILDWKMPSVEPVHVLHELRALKISTYCKSELRFSSFPRLEKCSLEWRPKATSLFECQTLTDLFLNRYKGKDCDPFSKLERLETLGLLSAPITNLEGLRGLKRLRKIRFARLRALSSLEGLSELSNLEELNIQSCRRIRSVAPLQSLSRLHTLHLNNLGEIESLAPLKGLSSLRTLTFTESTNVLDGDLSFLTTLKSVERISYQNRAHYSHRSEQFGKSFSGGLQVSDVLRENESDEGRLDPPPK